MREEVGTDNTIDVIIPVDAEAAKALGSPARREAAGRYLSSLLRSGHLPKVLADAIIDAKRAARASGPADADINAEVVAWRAERNT